MCIIDQTKMQYSIQQGFYAPSIYKVVLSLKMVQDFFFNLLFSTSTILDFN